MPRRKEHTPGADQVRTRILKACRFIVAKRINGVDDNKELCIVLGIAPARIQEWQRGQGHPTVQVMWDLKDLFGIGGDWMLAGQGSMIPGDPDMDLLAAVGKMIRQVERRRPSKRR